MNMRCKECGVLVEDTAPEMFRLNQELCPRCHIILIQFGLDPDKIERRDMGLKARSQIVVPRVVASVPLK